MADHVKRRNLSRNSWRESHGDGVIQTDLAFQAHEDRLYVHTHQPNKRAILENNRKLALLSDRHTKLTRGLRIPEEDMPAVVTRWPALVTGNDDERRNAVTAISRAHPEWVIIKYVPKYHSVPEVQRAG